MEELRNKSTEADVRYEEREREKNPGSQEIMESMGDFLWLKVIRTKRSDFWEKGRQNK